MSLLKKNEKEANLLVAKVMRITCVIFALIYVLNVVGIFVVDDVIMTVAFIGGAILLLLPTLLVNVMKQEDGWIKYLNVICASLFILLTLFRKHTLRLLAAYTNLTHPLIPRLRQGTLVATLHRLRIQRFVR